LKPEREGLLKHPWVERVVRQALEEDLGPRDVTTEVVLDGLRFAEAEIICQEEAVVCGLPIAGLVFKEVDPRTEFRELVGEGEEVGPGTVVAEVRGEAASILKGERVALNFLQHLSGVATLTRRLVEIASKYGVKIADTRKTLPGLRVLERYAVSVGGGVNHRFGLFDGIIIKDNHKRLCGGVGEAVRRAKARAPHGMRVEVEVESEEEAREALEAGADILLVDNASPELVRKVIEMAKGRALVEVSGGIGLSNIEEVARAGPDIISVGAITHSAPAVDFTLEIKGE